jgi:hypothetical protein
MVEAALEHASSTRLLDTPDTGTLRGDPKAIMRAANETRLDLLAAMTAILGAYFDETQSSPAQLREQILGSRRSAADTIFQRAIDRGEVDPKRITRRVTTLAFDLYRHEVLTTLQSVPDNVIDEIVDQVVIPLVSDSPTA